MFQTIVVCGPARTGTSLVMGLLDLLGYKVGVSRKGPMKHHVYYEPHALHIGLRKGQVTAQEAIAGLEAFKLPFPMQHARKLMALANNPKLIVTHRGFKSQFRSRAKAVETGRTRQSVRAENRNIYKLLDSFDVPRLDVVFEDWFSPKCVEQLKQLCNFVGREYRVELVDFMDPNKRTCG